MTGIEKMTARSDRGYFRPVQAFGIDLVYLQVTPKLRSQFIVEHRLYRRKDGGALQLADAAQNVGTCQGYLLTQKRSRDAIW